MIRRSIRTSDCSTFSPDVRRPHLDRRIAKSAKHLGDHRAHGRLVIDDQDRLIVSRLRCLCPLLSCRTSASALARMLRQVDAHGGPYTQLGVDQHLATGLLGKAVDHRKPEACALAGWLGCENGSKTCATISGGMPFPVSVTPMTMYWPGSMSRACASRSLIVALVVSIVIRPPFGMASRALMHRLRIAFSSWWGRTMLTRGRMRRSFQLDLGPTVRWSSS